MKDERQMDGKLDTPRTDMARDEPRSVVPLVGLTLLAGVCNFVLLATMYKAFGDEYAFFVNQAVNLGYCFIGAGIVWGRSRLGIHCINQNDLQVPHYKFMFLALLDGLGTFLTALGAVHTPGQYQPVLNQTLIPFTVIISMVVLQARFKTATLVGAGIILAGAIVAVLPSLLGTTHQSVDRGSSQSSMALVPEWLAISLYLLSNVPMAFSAVFKEVLFVGSKSVDVWYLCMWVSLYQFVITFLFIPLLAIRGIPGGMPLDQVWDSLRGGTRCMLGYSGTPCDAFAAPFPAGHMKGTFWLIGAYLLVNFTWNGCGLLLTKHSSAVLRSLSYSLVVPITSLAFTSALMGSLREPLSRYTLAGLFVVLVGFIVYHNSLGQDAQERAEDSSAEQIECTQSEQSQMYSIQERTIVAVCLPAMWRDGNHNGLDRPALTRTRSAPVVGSPRQAPWRRKGPHPIDDEVTPLTLTSAQSATNLRNL